MRIEAKYRNYLLITALMLVCLWGKSQNASVFVTDTATLYGYPSEDSSAMMNLLPQDVLFCFCDSTVNGFYRAIDIASDREGYVNSEQVQRGTLIPESKDAIFTPEGELNQREPLLKVINGTDTTISLRLNDTVYKLTPKEEKVLVLEPGYYRYVASAPGVLPMHGIDELKEYLRYRWRFFVKYPD